METIFDWITVTLFAGLIVLFMQRSTAEEPQDSLWQYLAASAGCALANYLGNEGFTVVAILVIAGVLGFVWVVLKPLEGWTQNKP